MPKVRVFDGKFDQALRKFKKKVANDKVLEEVRKREADEKPSPKRQRKLACAKARYRKKLRTEALQRRPGPK